MRKILVKKSVWALLLMTMLTGSALAAEDGCYCVGPDYLAYEFNDFAKPGHRLYLLGLNTEKGFGKIREMELEPFRAHGMRCLPEAVDMLAWDRIYRVELVGPNAMTINRVEPQPEDSVLPDFTNDNLLESSRVIPLKKLHGRYSFELVIESITAATGSQEKTPRQVKISLQQKNAAGVMVDEQFIFAGNREETVD